MQVGNACFLSKGCACMGANRAVWVGWVVGLLDRSRAARENLEILVGWLVNVGVFGDGK